MLFEILLTLNNLMIEPKELKLFNKEIPNETELKCPLVMKDTFEEFDLYYVYLKKGDINWEDYFNAGFPRILELDESVNKDSILLFVFNQNTDNFVNSVIIAEDNTLTVRNLHEHFFIRTSSLEEEENGILVSIKPFFLKQCIN